MQNDLFLEGDDPATGPTAARALTVLVVDDEPLARLRLRQLVEAPHGVPARVVGEAADAQSAQDWLAANRCELVLLDIALPGRSGLRLADELRRQAGAPQVVFVSAHAEHALAAFELEALDYLTKPVRRERLQAALMRAVQRRSERPAALDTGPVLVVSDRGRVLRVPAAEVLCLKADQKYVQIVTANGQWLVDEALTDLEQRLGPAFVRVHRNALVAVAVVRALERTNERVDAAADEPRAATAPTATTEAWSLRLSNGDRVAVSRRQLVELRAALRAPAQSRIAPPDSPT